MTKLNNDTEKKNHNLIEKLKLIYLQFKNQFNDIKIN